MARKISYYSIPVPVYPIEVKLCFTEEDFNKILEDHDINKRIISLEEGAAETHYIAYNGNMLIIAVFDLDGCAHAQNGFSLLGTICHEIVHLIDRIFDAIGEEDPGEEVRAYTSEFLFNNILRGVFYYVGSGKGNRKPSNKISEETFRNLSEMAKLYFRSTGSDSDPKQKGIVCGTENSDGKAECEANTRLRDAQGRWISGDSAPQQTTS